MIYFDFLSDLFGFLANPLMLLLMGFPVMVFVGIYIGTWLTQPRKNRVLKIEPDSERAQDLEIKSEDTINAYCDGIGNSPPQRFIKRHKALNVTRKGPFKLQNYALWLGIYGTAYTQMVKDGKTVEVPFRDAVLNVFGKTMYDRIPNDEKNGYIKDQIEKNEVGVTIQLPKGKLTPEGLPSISSDDMIRNDFNILIGALVKGIKMLQKAATGRWVEIIFILGSGIGIGIVLSLIFKWGGTTTVVEQPVQMLKGLLHVFR